MSEKRKLLLGIYKSHQKLLEDITKVTEVPDSLEVVETATGMMNEGQENQRPWANLIGVDSELYQTFASIGQEKFCPTFKVKLKGYKGEDLSTLVGATISFSKHEVTFIFDKFKQPIGLALVLELADISVI